MLKLWHFVEQVVVGALTTCARSGRASPAMPQARLLSYVAFREDQHPRLVHRWQEEALVLNEV
jgi:hypothetical protein